MYSHKIIEFGIRILKYMNDSRQETNEVYGFSKMHI